MFLSLREVDRLILFKFFLFFNSHGIAHSAFNALHTDHNRQSVGVTTRPSRRSPKCVGEQTTTHEVCLASLPQGRAFDHSARRFSLTRVCLRVRSFALAPRRRVCRRVVLVPMMPTSSLPVASSRPRLLLLLHKADRRCRWRRCQEHDDCDRRPDEKDRLVTCHALMAPTPMDCE